MYDSTKEPLFAKKFIFIEIFDFNLKLIILEYIVMQSNNL